MPRRKRAVPEFKLAQPGGTGTSFYVTWSAGRRTQRISTRTANEAEAKRFLADYVAGWDAPPEKAKITVSEVIDLYLKNKKEEYEMRGENTEYSRSNYQLMKGTLELIRPRFGHLHPSQLTLGMGRLYIKDMQKAGLALGTIRKRITLFNAAMRHGWKDGAIDEPRGLQLPPESPPKEVIMTAEQARQFLAEIKTPHIRLFALLALHTLSRKTAILQLQWKQVDMEKRLIDFNIDGRVRTKKRRTPSKINNVLYAALEEALQLAETDFVIEYKGLPCAEIRVAFSKVAKRVGMPWVTPHILRHTGGSLLAMEGVPLKKIAEQMGDTEKTVEKHYLKFTPDYLKQTSETLEKIYG